MRHSPMLMVTLLGAACEVSSGLVERQYCEVVPDQLPVSPVEEPLTWHRDVQPIIQARCERCHTEDDVMAPFPLTRWEDLASRAEVIRDSVVSGRMPPWSADDCCGRSFRLDRSLTPAELDTLVGWLDQGAPEGDPNDAPAESVTPDWGSLSRVDLRLTMPAPYLASPKQGDDELRCFLIDVPEESTGGYVVGARVIPGNRDIVHHVATGLVLPEHLAEVEALDALDDAPGWDCYGGTNVATTGNMGGYVPGQDGMELPPGLGIAVPRGAKLILNMHYDLSAFDGVPQEDQTSIEVMLEETVERPLVAIPVLHPLWLFDKGMALPGDFTETAYGAAWDPSVLYGRARRFELWGAFVHMHELGVETSFAILRQDGTQECLLHIERWDFDWQADYWYTEPVILEPGDQLYVECRFLNPYGDIAWEADQEMCAAVAYGAEVLP
ncbi:MAG: hypothetical protein RIT28_1931 [Pseudomonadota bacterium]